MYLLQDSDLKIEKSERALNLGHQNTVHQKNILKKARLCMKSWTLEAYCAENVFQIQPPICAVNFPSNMLKSDRTWHDLWNFLTINLKNKSFHNSIDSTGIYLQVYIPSRLAKFLWFTVSRFLESAFVKLPHPWHDLIINPLCGTGIPHKFAQKSLFPHVLWKSFLRKRSPHALVGTLCPCSTGKSCGGMRPLNICKYVD